MYKHIIWDFDGTLFDTYPVTANVLREALKEQKIEEPVEEINKQLRVSISSALRYYEEKYQISSEFISNYQERRIEAEVELSRPYDGIQEICKYIHSTNRKNYLFTHRGESSMILLKKHGLVDYFADFITSKHGFERKPSPDAIDYLINKHNMIHSESIMIGDRELDLLSGKNAKISACYFKEGNDDYTYADYTINDFQQLYSII